MNPTNKKPLLAKRNSFQGLISHASWALSSSIILVIAGFALNIVIGNKFGEDGFGVYSLSLTIYILANLVLTIGIPMSLTKYSAEFIDQGDIGAQYYTASLMLVFFSTLIGACVIYLSRGAFAKLFNMPELWNIIPILAIGVPFYGLGKVAIARLNGIRQMNIMAISEVLRLLFLVILTLIFVLFYHSGLIDTIWSVSLSDIILLPILLVLTRVVKNWNVTDLSEKIKQLGWFGGQVVLARIFEELDVRSNLIMVGIFLTKREVGLYSLAALLATALSVFPQAIQKVSGPAMTEMYAKGDNGQIENLVNQVMLIVAFVLTFAGAFLVMFFPEIIRILYPGQPGFIEARTTLIILVAAGIFYGITVSISPILLSIGRPDIIFKIALVRLTASILLTLAFIIPFRLAGAAIGGAETGVLVFIFWLYYIKKLIGLRINLTPLILIPLMGVASIFLVQFIPDFISPYFVRIILLGILGIVSFRLWHFDHYVKLLILMVHNNLIRT